MSGPRVAEARVEEPVLDGVRLDVFVADHMRLFSRSQAKRGSCRLVNGRPHGCPRRLKRGDRVAVTTPIRPPSISTPEAIPLAVIFENDDVVVVDKPQGMVVHPGQRQPYRHPAERAARPLRRARGRLRRRHGTARHRAPSRQGHLGGHHRREEPERARILAAQFAARTVKKGYVAIVAGALPSAAGRIATLHARDPAAACISPASARAGSPP